MYISKRTLLHFCHVLEAGLSEKYLVMNLLPQKVTIVNTSKFLPVQKGGFQETACPKDRLDGSWLNSWSWLACISTSCVFTISQLFKCKPPQLLPVTYTPGWIISSGPGVKTLIIWPAWERVFPWMLFLTTFMVKSGLED